MDIWIPKIVEISFVNSHNGQSGKEELKAHLDRIRQCPTATLLTITFASNLASSASGKDGTANSKKPSCISVSTLNTN